MLLAYILACLVASLAGLVTPSGAGQWASRSGEAEALADLSAGRPLKVYTHGWGGERAGFRSPGLLYCDPDQNIGSKAAMAIFATIADGDVSEGVRYTAAEQALQQSASAFARAYNLTIFRKKRDQIVALCPKVQLEGE